MNDWIRSWTVRVIEISELLGVSTSASRIADEPGFPRPVGREGQSRLWHRREIQAWAKGGAARSLALADELGLLPLATLDHLEELQRLRLSPALNREGSAVRVFRSF